MELQSHNSKFLSYIIILIALFFVVFVTKGIFETTQQHLDYKEELALKNSEAETELAELNTLKEKLKNNQDESTKNIARFAIDYKSEDIFQYVYSYVDGINSGNTGDTIIMRGLSL
jgi:predicted PurR-regulated permease PerM